SLPEVAPLMCGEQSDHAAHALNRRMHRLRDRKVQDIDLCRGMNGRRISGPKLWKVVYNLVGIDRWTWQEWRWCTHSDHDWGLHLFEETIFRVLEIQPPR